MSCCGSGTGNKSALRKVRPRVHTIEPTPQQIEKEVIVRYSTPKKTAGKLTKNEVPMDDDSDEADVPTGYEYTFKCYKNQDDNRGNQLTPDVAGSGYAGPPCPLICLLDEVDKNEKAKVMADLQNYQQKRRKLVLTASMLYKNKNN